MSGALSVNLIPKARQAKAERKRRLRFWTGAWCTYAVCLAVAAGFMYLRIGAVHDLSGELEQQSQQAAGLQTDIQHYNTQLLQVSQKLLSAKGLLEQPDWSQLLAVLADLRGTDVVLEDVELKLNVEAAPAPAPGKKPNPKQTAAARKTKWVLTIQGHGRTPQSVSQYDLRLEATDLFDEVNLLHTSSDPIGAGDAIGFAIECPLKGRGRAWQ